MERKVIDAKAAPKAIGPYVHAVQAGDLVFTSGQLGIDVEKGSMADGIVAQTENSLKNLKAILNEAGCDACDVVKTTIFLADINDFATVNEIYGKFFEAGAPARSCFQVAALPAGGLVEIEAIAVKQK